MGFTVPFAYARLLADGRFDYWGAPYEQLTEEQLEVLAIERRHSVLWFLSIEWDGDRTPRAIAAEPEDAETLPGLVWFAGNGYGDRYAWYLPWQVGPEPPVLFCPHDEDRAELFAEDFAGCLERLWLQHGAMALEEGHPVDQVSADLAAYLDIIATYLGADRVRNLEPLARTPDIARFAEAEDDLVASFARAGRELVGHNLMSTRYDLEYLGARVLPAYDESIEFFRALVEQGHTRFTEQLEAARANRAAAVAALAKQDPDRDGA